MALKVDTVLTTIVACTVLHKSCIQNNDIMDIPEPLLENEELDCLHVDNISIAVRSALINTVFS